MSLLEYLRLLLQRGWIIALCAALAAAGMVIYSQRQTTVYRSSMQIIFEPVTANQTLSAGNNSLLRSYVVDIHTTETAAEIVADLGMGISPLALKGGTEISAVPDQSLIKIEVNDTDGEWANVVALAWGQKLIDRRNRQNIELPATEQIAATIHDMPQYGLYRPKLVNNALLGGVAGVLVGAVIVYILEARKYRLIRYRQDLSDLQFLATIPRESA